MKLIRSFLDLLFPPLCFSCSSRLSDSRHILCCRCEAKLYWLENVCSVCGNKLSDEHCSYCSSNTWYFDRAFSLFTFNEVVQKLIHDLKYNDMLRVVDHFQVYLDQFLKKNKLLSNVDLIAPVPIHWVRRRERGYNQAELISSRIAEIMSVKHSPNLIKRKKHTSTQTKLNREERNINVASAFCLKKESNVVDKTILLIDDVFTTGSTVNSISKLLKEHNCSKVYVLTISHA